MQTYSQNSGIPCQVSYFRLIVSHFDNCLIFREGIILLPLNVLRILRLVAEIGELRPEVDADGDRDEGDEEREEAEREAIRAIKGECPRDSWGSNNWYTNRPKRPVTEELQAIEDAVEDVIEKLDSDGFVQQTIEKNLKF